MATTSHTVVIFEGIASVDVDGVAHDTYMTIRTEAVGQTIRWFGSFGWMGKAPKGLFHGEFLDATLSDGRECQIYIPHPPDDNGQVDFLGQKMPPGFEWFQPELVTAELRSTTPAWRVRLSRVLATVALALVILSFWWHDFRWESFGTGVLLSLVAVFLIPSRPRPLPEVPLDCPHQ